MLHAVNPILLGNVAMPVKPKTNRVFLYLNDGFDEFDFSEVHYL